MKLIQALVIVLVATGARAETDAPLLLASKFGDLCSICAAMLRCTPDAEGAAATVYTFHQLTFAGQMRTVFDYVPRMKPPTQDRPVTIAREGAPSTEAMATFDRLAARILLPGPEGAPAEIDRKSGAWRQGDVVLGRCVFVPRVRRTEAAQK